MCMKILSFGCKKIRAFPLQIVANSKLVKRNGIDYVQKRRRNQVSISIRFV